MAAAVRADGRGGGLESTIAAAVAPLQYLGSLPTIDDQPAAMLDINLFREDRGGNPELVRESQRRRFADVGLVDKVLEHDEEWRKGERVRSLGEGRGLGRRGRRGRRGKEAMNAAA